MKILIPQIMPEKPRQYLLDRGYELVEDSGSADPKVLAQELADVDGLVARVQPFTAEVLESATKLKCISRFGVGVDNVPLDYCAQRGIRVTNAPESNAVSVAEHTVGMMIACAHHFPKLDRAVRQGNWAIRTGYAGCDLQGKTLGIVGMGRIGAMVAKMCQTAFGMDVACYGGRNQVEGVRWAETLEELLRCADFVSLHIPSTLETYHIINAQTLAMMKPTAILINCARGGVVDEEALAQALRTGALYGAAVDVMSTEPPVSSPLFGLENILLTPHTAALTVESLDRMGLHAAMGIDDVLSGRQPKWGVV